MYMAGVWAAWLFGCSECEWIYYRCGSSIFCMVSSSVSGGMLLFYVLAASVVYIGMKLVGICEKIAVISMFGVIGILFVATMLSETTELSTKFYSNNNMLALYSMIAFSLSAVMSVPQVVKGLEGDEKGIRKAIAAGTGLNMGLILLITFMTLPGCSNVTENGALVDLSGTILADGSALSDMYFPCWLLQHLSGRIH